MKALSGREFCKLLESRGWRLMRVRGSHHVYARAGAPVRISVPVHGNRALKRGLRKYLMKLAGMDESAPEPDD